MRAVLEPTAHAEPTAPEDPVELADLPVHPDRADAAADMGAEPEDDGYAPVVVSRDGVLRPVWADRTAAAREYFDTEWGCPVTDERGLFELVALLVFAGGLTWAGVLAKRDGLRVGLGGFDPDVVARFSDDDVAAALADASMIRNERKIRAVVTNARAVVALRESGGLVDLVWSAADDENDGAPIDLRSVPRADDRSAALATALREAGFVHIGPIAAQALLLAAGVVPVERGQTPARPAPDAEGNGVQECF